MRHRRSTVVAAVAIVGSVLAGAVPANAGTGGNSTGAPAQTQSEKPMVPVQVTELVTHTPDSAGKVRVRLADGKEIAIPAEVKDVVMRFAKGQAGVSPDDVVVGNCGSSYIEVETKPNEHPVRMTTGFKLRASAIAYGWEATISGPNYNYTYTSGGGLAFRSSWDGSYESPVDQLEGDYSAAVAVGSFAVLWSGLVCYSGGPTDDEYLTSPDAPITQPLFSSANSPAAPAVTTPGSVPTGDQGGSPAFLGSDAGHSPSNAAPLDQTRVSDTRVFPYRAVTALKITDVNGLTYNCTGFLYAANMVATAGHCLHFAGVWARTVEATPAQNVNEAPFGKCRGTTAYSTRGWVLNRDRRYDYGAIKLDCNVGEQAGWFGMYWTTGTLTGTPVTVTGFPADQAPTGSMWTNSGTIATESERQVTYPIVVGPEESGSPVYTSPAYQAVAVHAYGPEPGQPTWKGTRITRAAFGNYTNWKS